MPQVGGVAAHLNRQVVGVPALLKEGAELALPGRQLAAGLTLGPSQAGCGGKRLGHLGRLGRSMHAQALGGRHRGGAAALVGERTGTAFPFHGPSTIAAFVTQEEVHHLLAAFERGHKGGQAVEGAVLRGQGAGAPLPLDGTARLPRGSAFVLAGAHDVELGSPRDKGPVELHQPHVGQHHGPGTHVDDGAQLPGKLEDGALHKGRAVVDHKAS